jgi:hypothetical protein
MKKIYLIILSVLSLALLIAPACKPGNIAAQPGQEFQLSPGQQASIKGEDLNIEFVRVSEDSRCPTGVTWIWEGRAVSLLKITRGGNATDLYIIQMGSSDQTGQDYLGYHFVFNLTPYPAAGKDIREGDYSLILKVTRTAWKDALEGSNFFISLALYILN